MAILFIPYNGHTQNKKAFVENDEHMNLQNGPKPNK